MAERAARSPRAARDGWGVSPSLGGGHLDKSVLYWCRLDGRRIAGAKRYLLAGVGVGDSEHSGDEQADPYKEQQLGPVELTRGGTKRRSAARSTGLGISTRGATAVRKHDARAAKSAKQGSTS